MAQHREVVDSSPAEYRDVQCSNPEVLELKGFQSGCGEFEDEPFGVGNNFGRNIHECPTQRGCKGANGDERAGDILLEGLEEEESHQHKVVEGAVGFEAGKGHFLGAEILEGAVNQLIRPARVV